MTQEEREDIIVLVEDCMRYQKALTEAEKRESIRNSVLKDKSRWIEILEKAIRDIHSITRPTTAEEAFTYADTIKNITEGILRKKNI